MKIGVFGTGVVGRTISEKLITLGHEVMMGTRDVKTTLSRTESGRYGQPSYSEWHKKNPQVKIGPFGETAKFGEFLISALLGAGSLPALNLAGSENMANKILLDISNPLDFSKGMPPSLLVSNTDSMAEQIQRAYPDMKVVKSLNTVTAYVMVNPGQIDEDHQIFVNGNDEEAKKQVCKLLNSFGWKNDNIIDLGDITASRGVEQYLPLWVRILSKFQNPLFNIKIVWAKP